MYNILGNAFDLIFLNSQGHLMSLLLAGILTIIPIAVIYRRVPGIVYTKEEHKHSFLINVLYIVCIVLVAVGLNVVLTRFTVSTGSSRLTDGSLVLKLLCNCLVIPILEELLYRGIVLGQLYVMYGARAAILISAFCFGFFHFNLIQFLYAFIVGLVIGLAYVRTKHILVPIIGHGLANLVVVIYSVLT